MSAMSAPKSPEMNVKEPPPRAAGSAFFRRLQIATLSVLLLYLSIELLGRFQAILQPFFAAVFLSYAILPAHRWLERKGIPSAGAYVVLLLMILAGLVGLGSLLYYNVQSVVDRLPEYQQRFNVLIDDLLQAFGVKPERRAAFFRELELLQPQSTREVIARVRQGLGTFFSFFGALALTFVYLVFVAVERSSFSRRITLALGNEQGERVLGVTSKINHAISQYLAVKTLMSFLAGVFTAALLALFDLDFYWTWGILAFLLNYIPYLGSLVATILPVLLALVQLGLGPAIMIGILLVAMQQVLGVVVEPRMAGQRLGVSPLLILLSLAFWGAVWGIVGMILAVPLLVSIKIILDNIKETQPVAALMAHINE